MEAKVKSITRTSDGRYLLSVQLADNGECVIISFVNRDVMLAVFKNASEDLSYVIKRHTKADYSAKTKSCDLKVEDLDALLNYAQCTVRSATVEVSVSGDASAEQKEDTLHTANAPADATADDDKKVYTNYYLDSVVLSRTGMLEFERLCK